MFGGVNDQCRRLITLSRQGGVSLKDQYAKQKEEAAAKLEKNGKGAGKQKAMAKSQSAPMLVQTGSLSGTSRMGGGWARTGTNLDLTKYRELLDYISEMKGDIDFCEKPFFRTALWEATWKNHETIVKLLAARGAEVSKADYQGRTPLHEAAYYGHLNLVEFFVNRGHPIDCVDAFGQTPLFRAADAGRADVVRYLVERGAQTNDLDSHGVTVQHVAAFKGLPRLSEFLRYSGAQRNRYAIDERSPHSLPKLASGSLLSGATLVMR